VAARGAAQQPAVRVIGFLNPATPNTFSDRLRGFRQGLKETGFVEGENVAIEYRSAENHWRLRAEMEAAPQGRLSVTGCTRKAKMPDAWWGSRQRSSPSVAALANRRPRQL
jgi:hypothetical protein